MKTESSHGWEPVRACVAAPQSLLCGADPHAGGLLFKEILVQWMVEGLVWVIWLHHPL